MNTKWMTAAAALTGTLMLGGVASAQTKDEAKSEGKASELAPATHAVELTVGTGYAQAFGRIGANQPSFSDVSSAGGAVNVSVGYRLIPQLTIGGYGEGSMFSRGDGSDSSTNLYSAAAGAKADWHFLPGGHELDPWVSLGTGWRGYWASADAGTTALHGWTIAKRQVGIDYRLAQAVAISPVIGADLTTFFTQSTPTSNGFRNIESPDANLFLFAGVQGRFDIPTGPRDAQVASR